MGYALCVAEKQGQIDIRVLEYALDQHGYKHLQVETIDVLAIHRRTKYPFKAVLRMLWLATFLDVLHLRVGSSLR